MNICQGTGYFSSRIPQEAVSQDFKGSAPQCDEPRDLFMKESRLGHGVPICRLLRSTEDGYAKWSELKAYLRWDAFQLELLYAGIQTTKEKHVLDAVLWRNIIFVGTAPPLTLAAVAP